MEDNFIIGSHNSMTYLPIKNWILKPFNWMAKCQKKNLLQQIEDGIQLIDFRVYLDNTSHWAFKHGMIKYDTDAEKKSAEFAQYLSYYDGCSETYDYDRYCKYDDDIYYYLDFLKEMTKNSGKKYYIRIILESVRKEFVEFDKDLFKILCKSLEREYPNFTFFGGNYKKNWEKIYTFENKINYEQEFDQWVSSMQKCGPLEKLCPWLYAKWHNNKNKQKMTNKYNSFDFV